MLHIVEIRSPLSQRYDDDDDDDDYLRLQHGKGFHNVVYMSYVIHMNPSNKAKVMNTYSYKHMFVNNLSTYTCIYILLFMYICMHIYPDT
jgi:hypothetical protein